MPLIERRAFLRGLFAAPAIIAASSLMPLRGISMLAPAEPVFRHYVGYDIIGWDEIVTTTLQRRSAFLDANVLLNNALRKQFVGTAALMIQNKTRGLYAA